MTQSSVQETFNLALQHFQARRLSEAEILFKQVLAQQPNHTEALHQLGLLNIQLGKNQTALDLIQRTVVLNPKDPRSRNNLGGILQTMGYLDDAITEFRHAIKLQPNSPGVYYNLGTALQSKGMLDDSIVAFRQAAALAPEHPPAHDVLGLALKEKGLLDQAIAAHRKAIALDPNFSEAGSKLLMTLHYHPGYTAQDLAEEQRRWDLRHAEPLKQFILPHANDKNPDRRLRIGYVSPDFRDHVVGRNVWPMLERHDHKEFEIYAYANSKTPDAMTQRMRALTDQWRDIVNFSDEDVARRIRDDQIDILVDLTLHTAGNRLLVFARKPAPVQVTYAGYPGSTGLTAIDYRLSDPYLDPPGMDESIYSEKTIRLPDSFWCYDPLEERHTSANSLPAAKNKYITFGCLNNFCKINEGILLLWAHIMRQVEESRLKLMAKPGDHRQRTIDFLAQHGIRPGRVEFFEGRPRREYLKLYHRVDVGLDSFPYNGHTTSLDSLWMGVPVVTLVGQTVVSRAGWCQLSNLGLTELAAQTPEQYVKIAVQLAGDLPRLKELRSTLRKRMEASPLMDAPRFARNIEAAYRQMWRTWCQQSSTL
jgi:predicted O-linked N-acetylglucosamine transferase (SPINDLY family)